MRIWKKYQISEDIRLRGKNFPRTYDIESFHQELGEMIDTKERFYEICKGYLPNQVRQLLSLIINKDQKVISIGCGDGEHEIPLIEEGYNIHLSDFNIERLNNTKALFPFCHTIELDILNKNFNTTYEDLLNSYDVVFIPGIFAPYDDHESVRILNNLRKLMKSDGCIIVLHRARNSMLTGAIDRICKFDTVLHNFFYHYLKQKKRMYIYSVHHGYRRSLKEFSDLVQSSGLKKTDIIYADHVTELSRLNILRKFRLVKILGRILGDRIAYLNCYVLKVQPESYEQKL